MSVYSPGATDTYPVIALVFDTVPTGTPTITVYDQGGFSLGLDSGAMSNPSPRVYTYDLGDLSAPYNVKTIPYDQLLLVLEDLIGTADSVTKQVQIVNGPLTAAATTELLSRDLAGHLTPGTVGYSLAKSTHLDAAVWVKAGAPSGTAWPLGTQDSPVGNLTDAGTIAIARGIRTLNIFGSTFNTFTLTAGLGDFQVRGFTKNNVIDFNGMFTSNATLYGLGLTGDYLGVLRARDCELEDVTTAAAGSPVELHRCGLKGTNVFTGASGFPSLIEECYAFEDPANSVPVVNLAGPNQDVSIKGFKGPLEITGSNNAATRICVTMHGGQIVFGPTNTLGEAEVYGDAEVLDTSGGGFTVTKHASLGPDPVNYNNLLHAAPSISAGGSAGPDEAGRGLPDNLLLLSYAHDAYLRTGIPSILLRNDPSQASPDAGASYTVSPTDNLRDLILEPYGERGNIVLDASGVLDTNARTKLRNLVVVGVNGEFSGGTFEKCLFTSPILASPLKFNGLITMTDCRFSCLSPFDWKSTGNFHSILNGGSQATDCQPASFLPVEFRMGGMAGGGLNLVGWTGDLKMTGISNAGHFSFVELKDGATLELDATSDNGFLKVYGNGTLIGKDLAVGAGLTVDDSALVTPVPSYLQDFVTATATRDQNGFATGGTRTYYPTAQDQINETNPIRVEVVESSADGSFINAWETWKSTKQ